MCIFSDLDTVVTHTHVWRLFQKSRIVARIIDAFFVFYAKSQPRRNLPGLGGIARRFLVWYSMALWHLGHRSGPPASVRYILEKNI
jgi:hypothetical protein